MTFGPSDRRSAARLRQQATRRFAIVGEPRRQLHHHAAAGMLQLDQSRLRELLGEVEEGGGAVIALGEGGIELQEGALEESGLRRDFAVREDLERAPHHGETPALSGTRWTARPGGCLVAPVCAPGSHAR